MTVGVVDSGCDASHPDLADHVAHNVKLYSGEYVNLPPDSSSTIVVPLEMRPALDDRCRPVASVARNSSMKTWTHRISGQSCQRRSFRTYSLVRDY